MLPSFPQTLLQRPQREYKNRPFGKAPTSLSHPVLGTYRKCWKGKPRAAPRERPAPSFQRSAPGYQLHREHQEVGGGVAFPDTEGPAPSGCRQEGRCEDAGGGADLPLCLEAARDLTEAQVGSGPRALTARAWGVRQCPCDP